MCGIAGFVLNDLSDAPEGCTPPAWLAELAAGLEALPAGAEAAPRLGAAIARLQDRFGEMMSWPSARALATGPAVAATVARLSALIEGHESALVTLSEAGQTELDPVIEGLRDMGWQIREELVKGTARILDLLSGRSGARAFAGAFAIEAVLTAIDRLEVRGRDSAGIHVQIALPAGAWEAIAPRLDADPAFAARSALRDATDGAIAVVPLAGGETVLGFTYKTANLIGRLGDNCAALRAALRADALIWPCLGAARQVDVLAHTRWASSGVISVANCHPHDAALQSDAPGAAETQWIAVLNGDVDNHLDLNNTLLTAHQRQIDPAITTDAKIIPLACRFADPAMERRPAIEIFRSAVRRLDGSMAIATLNAALPGEVLIAQKGSGQGMHLAHVADGWMFASEVYGLASLTRRAHDLTSSVYGGTVTRVRAGAASFEARAVGDDSPVTMPEKDIQIYARDIYRGAFDSFLEKEIHDAPRSVAKTLRGRYRHEGDRIRFDGLATDIWANLRQFLESGIANIYVIGQGTAGVAAAGIAERLNHNLAQGPRRLASVRALRASEMSAEIDALDMRNALVIAVSQSGTTTDTNRAVDLAIARGAFVHAIVNRRGSDLVRKAHSVLFTSDGRDIEMSVASTKAFYAQLVAGELTALFLADRMTTLSPLEITRAVRDLELLPAKIEEVLALDAEIDAIAAAYAPSSRYWAVVGSGVNNISAMEIRIKLSELCYKSIPVDFTEDKKHIDLSTEPLTLVMATDTPPELLGDLVKEAAIFRAHNGKPIVFATAGAAARAFETHAEKVIALPAIGSGLGFILGAAAGHIFGLHAAQAIDRTAQPLRRAFNALGEAATSGDAAALASGRATLDEVLARAVEGDYDSGLASRNIATLALWQGRLRGLDSAAPAERPQILREAERALRAVFEETSRPIDTIRHQAKTVTVGTSRPDDVLSPILREAMAIAGVSEAQLGAADRRSLAAISKLVEEVPAVAAFRVEHGAQENRVTYAAGNDTAARGAYASARAPIGTLGFVLERSKLALGRTASHVQIAAPLFGEDSFAVAGLIQFTLHLQEAAPREHKVAALRALDRYGEILRHWQDIFGEEAEGMLLLEISQTQPETLLCHDEEIIERALVLAQQQRSAS